MLVVIALAALAAATPSEPSASPAAPLAETSAPVNASSSSSPPLADAEAALRAGIHDRCVSLAAEAIKRGGLDEITLANAWLVRGRCYMLAGDVDRAERSYAVAVRVQPDIVLPTEDAAFARVKGEGHAAPTKLTLVADAVVVGGGDVVIAIDVALNDDLRLGASVTVFDKDGEEIISAPVDIDIGIEDNVAGAGIAADDGADHGADGADVAAPAGLPRRVHRFSGFPVEGTSVVLRDKAGNRLRSVGVNVGDDVRAALSAAGATPTASAPARRIPGTLAYVGGGVMAVGLVSSMVMGIQFAVVAQADERRVLDDELPWLAGFVGGVALVVVGGGLVVTEGL